MTTENAKPTRRRAWEYLNFSKDAEESGRHYFNLDARGRILDGNDFSYHDMMNLDFRDAELKNVSFRESDLMNADFRGATLVDVCFDDAALKNVEFAGATFERVTFVDTVAHNVHGLESVIRRERNVTPAPGVLGAVRRMLGGR